MKPLPTVILHHVTPQGSHYDWLMTYPYSFPQSAPGLWTARIDHPPTHWRIGQRLTLTPLPDHRPHYLHYQGPISGGRGHVRRVAQGEYTARLWTAHRRLLDIHWEQPLPPMQVELHLSADQPHALVIASGEN